MGATFQQEDGWDDADAHTASAASAAPSSERQEPVITSDPGVLPADGAHQEPTVGFLEDSSSGTAQNTGDSGLTNEKPGKPAGEKKGKVAVSKKKSSGSTGGSSGITPKKIILGMAGVFGVGVLGIGGFWYVQQSQSSAPDGYAVASVTHTVVHQQHPVVLPMTHSHPMTGEQSMPPVQENRSAVSPVATVSSMATSGAVAASQSVGSESTGERAASLALPSENSSRKYETGGQPATSVAVANATSSDSSAVALEGLQTRIAGLQKQVQHWKEVAQQAQAQLSSVQQSAAKPKVIYRTIVRYIPSPAASVPAPQKKSPSVQPLPSGYRIVGGAGGSVVVLTPSGQYRAIRQGDMLAGHVVQSVRDGKISW